MWRPVLPKAAENQEPARRSKRDAVLDQAAAHLNARGISQTSLSRIAASLGVSRAALYYYVEDREDLVFQCYRRACETMARDLSAAAKAPGTGLERLLTFVERALDTERPEPAVLSEIAYLDSPQRETIEALHEGNLGQLVRLIEAARADGSLRDCHPLVVAQAVIGMISWIPLAPRWSGETGDSIRTQAREGVRILLTDGIATDPATALGYMPLDIDVLRPERGGAFDREAVAAMELEDLLRAASRLVNRKGVEATSIDEVAAEVGATKGVVYHYLADKPDLVARCYRRAFDMADRVLKAVERANGSGVERSLQGLRLLVEINLRDEFCPLAPLAGFEALPDNARKALAEQVRGTETGFPDVARDGVADGTVRDVDLQAVAIAMAGAFGWLHKWYAPDIVASEAVIDEHVRLMACGLRRRP